MSTNDRLLPQGKQILTKICQVRPTPKSCLQQNYKLSGTLSRARHYLPHVVMRGLYYGLIYPYLSYGNIVQGNTYTKRLELKRRLQKKL